MKMKLAIASLEVLALSLFSTCACANTDAVGAAPADAQGAAASATGQNVLVGDIVVTARRRQETSLQTPVVLNAFSGEQLARFNVTSLIDVAKLTPQLGMATTVGPYGGIISLRGVSSPTSNPGAEGAVTINFDGVPVSFGAVMRMSAFDISGVAIPETCDRSADVTTSRDAKRGTANSVVIELGRCQSTRLLT